MDVSEPLQNLSLSSPFAQVGENLKRVILIGALEIENKMTEIFILRKLQGPTQPGNKAFWMDGFSI
jgi:hypothetical protein